MNGNPWPISDTAIDINLLNENQKKEALQEGRILKKLDHSNIIKLKEVFIAKWDNGLNDLWRKKSRCI